MILCIEHATGPCCSSTLKYHNVLDCTNSGQVLQYVQIEFIIQNNYSSYQPTVAQIKPFNSAGVICVTFCGVYVWDVCSHMVCVIFVCVCVCVV